MEYHRRLGYTGTIQYIGPDMLVPFLLHEGIKELIRQKQLQLVLWDRVSLEQGTLLRHCKGSSACERQAC